MKSWNVVRAAVPGAALVLGALSCDETVVNVDPAPGTPGASTGNIVGRVSPATSGARVIVTQAVPVDSATIDPRNGAFVVANLGPGTYDVVVRAATYRIARLEQVAVFAGSVSYVGAIELSTTPDAVRSFAPSQSEVVLSGEYPRLAIGIDFVEPMDRVSVQSAFTTDPPSSGVFYWSQSLPQSPTDHTGRRSSDDAPPGYGEAPGGDITTFRNIRSLRYIPRQRDTYVDTTYVVRLARTARDSAGQEMRFALQFSFSTIQTQATITSIQTQPEDGARGVSLLGYSSLRVTFPKRMDQASVEDALTMTPPLAPIFLWPEGNVLVLYTGGPLRALTTYTVHIDDTARDLDGNRLPEPFEFSFDTEAVMVRNNYPSAGQVFVDFSTDLRIQLSFNTYIVRSTLPAAWSIVPAVSGQMVWVDNSYVYFKPSTSLLPNTKYTVTISTAVQDLHGSRPTAPFTFAFVTRPE